MLVVADTGSGAVALIIFLLLPPALVMLFVTYGRSYLISENLITKINLITGKKQSVYVSAIGRIQVKPIAFGYGHIILTLADGYRFNIKNIKLLPNIEAEYFLKSKREEGLYIPKARACLPYSIVN